MATLTEDDLTIMTDAHRRVLRIVENMGLRVKDEEPFPPFQVDIYVPEFHAAIEADGPMHSPSKDFKRDVILLERYGLVVVHVSIELTSNQIRGYVQGALMACKDDAEERFEAHKDEMPWL